MGLRSVLVDTASLLLNKAKMDEDEVDTVSLLVNSYAGSNELISLINTILSTSRLFVKGELNQGEIYDIGLGDVVWVVIVF